eukprot:6727374-Pyramimonas_sp.AAC.1
MGSFDTIDSDWNLTPKANPWAQQVLEDLSFAHDHCEDFYMLVPSGYPLLKLLYIDEFRDWAYLDFTVLRAAAYSKQFAPPEHHPEAPEVPEAEEETAPEG